MDLLTKLRLQYEQRAKERDAPGTGATRYDPLDTPAELTARVDEIWADWLATEDECVDSAAVRIALAKACIRTALIRAQRDAAHRALNRCKALIAETMS